MVQEDPGLYLGANLQSLKNGLHPPKVGGCSSLPASQMDAQKRAMQEPIGVGHPLQGMPHGA